MGSFEEYRVERFIFADGGRKAELASVRYKCILMLWRSGHGCFFA